MSYIHSLLGTKVTIPYKEVNICLRVEIRIKVISEINIYMNS